jgi:hypothetical protein
VVVVGRYAGGSAGAWPDRPGTTWLIDAATAVMLGFGLGQALLLALQLVAAFTSAS